MYTKSKVLVGSIKKGNSSTISLTVELFPIYAFELISHLCIRTISHLCNSNHLHHTIISTHIISLPQVSYLYLFTTNESFT